MKSTRTRPTSVAAAVLATALAACGVGLTPEEQDWQVINELGLEYVTVEEFDELEGGMTYDEAAATLPAEGVELTSAEHLPARGIGNMRRAYAAAIESYEDTIYAWQNHDNEIMMAVFHDGTLSSTWDGEYVSVFTKMD